jgi:hypothetical protein
MPTAATAEALTLDQVLDQITATKAQLSILEDRLAGLLDQLSTALDDGEIDPKFSHEDWTFTHSEGRKTWTYPETVKKHIKSLQELSQADGTATVKNGAPYWIVKAPAI